MGKAMTSIAAALFLFLSLRPADPPPLLPRTLILESSERGNPRLSPDGKRVAYCALHDGVENVWVKTIGQNDERVVTHDTRDGIANCFWQADGEHLLYFQDRSGDENTHLFQVDMRSGQTRDLTPFANARAMGLIRSPQQASTLLVHVNARDGRFFDLYRLDLKTGKITLDTPNPGDVSRFFADRRLRVRAAAVTNPDNSAEIRVRDGDAWRPLIGWGAEEMNSNNTGIAGFNADGSKRNSLAGSLQ